jgi:hypothetical protein
MKRFIGIAVERYLESPKISEVKYAEADVLGFSQVLQQHGFSQSDQQLLINENSTQSRIRSVVKTTLDSLCDGDILYFYFAGHGVGISGTNYISCYDSRKSDLPGTCIEISWLFEQFKASQCKRIALFLDSCRSGMIGPEGARDLYSEFDSDAIKKFLLDAEYCTCFAACKTDQSSWPSTKFGHGIWTYHLIEAFDGRASMALKDQLLTDTSLQNYLQHIVPLSLRDVDPSAMQSPWKYGGASSDFELADLTAILEGRRLAKYPRDSQVKDAVLMHKENKHITRLTGFSKKKGHFVPDRGSPSVDAFIGKLVSSEVEQELKEIRDALKAKFGFTRLECKINHEGGSGTVTTPHFNYNITVEQDIENHEEVVWRRSIEGIIEPEDIFTDEFESVFPDAFDTIELHLHEASDLDAVVDFVERLKKTNKDIDVEFDDDEDIEFCIIRMKGHAPIHLTRKTFAIVHNQPSSPKVLVDSLFGAQLALTQTYNLMGIPFEASTTPKVTYHTP